MHRAPVRLNEYVVRCMFAGINEQPDMETVKKPTAVDEEPERGRLAKCSCGARFTARKNLYRHARKAGHTYKTGAEGCSGRINNEAAGGRAADTNGPLEIEVVAPVSVPMADITSEQWLSWLRHTNTIDTEQMNRFLARVSPNLSPEMRSGLGTTLVGAVKAAIEFGRSGSETMTRNLVGRMTEPLRSRRIVTVADETGTVPEEGAGPRGWREEERERGHTPDEIEVGDPVDATAETGVTALGVRVRLRGLCF